MLVQKLLSIAQVSGQAVLYILLLLSVLSIGIILERLVYFARRKIDAAVVGRKVVDYLREGDVDGARGYLSTLPGVEAEVIRDALSWYADGPDAVAEVIAGGTKERRKSYESGLLFLGTLGNNAPFVGLFGTVLGIVTAFKELAGAAGNSAGMNNVMSGIAEALVATAVGILVALPAVIAYNAFQKKSQDLEENTMSIGNLVMAQMKSVKQEAA
jgi:biopolymer transport protein ExbB/TolQ